VNDLRGSIVYNLDQATPAFLAKHQDYQAFLRELDVWDYSTQNIENLRHLSNRIFHVPIGFDPVLERIPRAPRQTIDVLFYGSMTDRRKKVWDKLQDSGLAVQHLFGVYGQERDAFIARSKIILNLHHSEEQTNFEIVRVAYALNNRKAVVG